MNSYLFTSESVSEGHPDKVSDQISDAILDGMLAGDKFSRVACETLVTTGQVVVAGEVTSKSFVDIQATASSPKPKCVTIPSRDWVAIASPANPEAKAQAM